MKELIQKTKNQLIISKFHMRDRFYQFLVNTGLISVICTLSNVVYANEGGTPANGDLDTQMKNAMGAVLGNILTVFKYVGMGLLIAGIVQLILAFKDDNADGKQRAIMLCGISIALILIKPFLTGINIINLGIK